MFKRLPTMEERAELARKRAERRAELLEQAEQIRAEAAVLAGACMDASGDSIDAPGQRLDALLARLELARAALAMALMSLQEDDPVSLGDHPERLERALGRWKRASEGWWEARFVPRPRVIISIDQDTNEIRINVVYWSYGPYFYRHWRQDGKQVTEYFGRTVPDDYPDQELPEQPSPQLIAPTSALTREALALAERLATRYNEAEGALRPRLHRLVGRAGRRVQRRLRADATSYAVLSDDHLPIALPDVPPVAVSVDGQVLEQLDALVSLLTSRTQLGRAAGVEAHATLVAGLDALLGLIARRAALDDALRRARAVDLPEDPRSDEDLARVLAMVAHEPTLRSLRERLAVVWADLQARGQVRGASLVAWRDLAVEGRRELRRLNDLVTELAQRAQGQGIPVGLWIAEADRVAGRRAN